MKKIGGNVIAEFQAMTVFKNEIGEDVESLNTVAKHRGFLDLSSGNSSYEKYKTKMEEATHIFICDTFDIDRSKVTRLSIKESAYDVVYFDEPMEFGFGYHFEIFLKRVEQYGS